MLNNINVISKVDEKKVITGKAVILGKVNSYEDISFGHIVMAEDILMMLGIDHNIIMKAVIAKRNKEDEPKPNTMICERCREDTYVIFVTKDGKFCDYCHVIVKKEGEKHEEKN